jgi:hypothetical protein
MQDIRDSAGTVRVIGGQQSSSVNRSLCVYAARGDAVVCERCGDRRQRAVKRPCPASGGGATDGGGLIDDVTAATITCGSLGKGVRTFQRGVFSCADQSDLQLLECRRLRQPVTVAPVCGDIAETIADRRHSFHVVGYRGTNCFTCEYRTPVQVPVPEVTAHVSVLAAVTAYFNPQHSTTRRENWFRCAEHLADQGIYLATVEGVREGDKPDLPGVHSVQQVSFRDVLWHKERLLNLAIERLDDVVDAVAWVDADVLWDCTDLRDRPLEKLGRYYVIQPWAKCELLGADGKPQKWLGGQFAQSMASGNKGRPGDASPHKKHPGFAWAARLQTLVDMGGLYEGHVTGGGDTQMAIGFYGDFRCKFMDGRMTTQMRASWLEWAKKAYAAVRGNVGFLDSTISHLYHGEIGDRKYLDRCQMLVRNEYDPARHIRVAESGALEWTEEAPLSLITDVADYLLRRRKEP